MKQPFPHPVRYDPALDLPDGDEQQMTDEISKVMTQATTYADEGRGVRGVHAKSHGLLQAQLEIPEGLPSTLAQGVFEKPGIHQVVMRLSATPGNILSDKVSTPRGLAIEILDVDGPRLEGSEDATTQDFLFVNSPTFSAKDAKGFLSALKMVASTTDRAEEAKKGLSAVLRATETAVEAIGGTSTALWAIGGEQPRHVLGQTYFSQLPQRFGDFIARPQPGPVSNNLTALKNQKVDLGESDTILRDKVVEFFENNQAVWELRAQLCTDPDDTPIDNPSKPWDEKISTYFAVARITAPQQLAWSDKREDLLSDGLGFSPWHGIEAHRLIGAIMRIRKSVYERSQAFRSGRGAIPSAEPRNDTPSTNG